MVSIAIIAILAGLLVPTLHSAQGSAISIRCMGNLKQIGIISNLYCNENDNFMIPAMPAEPVEHWINWMFKNGANGSKELFRCPQVDMKNDFNPYGGNEGYGMITDASYIMNVIGTDSVTQNDAWGDAVVPYEGIHTDVKKYGWTVGDSSEGVNLNKVNNPSNSIYITDIASPLTNTFTAKGIYRFEETDHGIYDLNGNQESNAHERKVGFQHNGRFNALFGDSHCKSLRKSNSDQWVVITKP